MAIDREQLGKLRELALRLDEDGFLADARSRVFGSRDPATRAELIIDSVLCELAVIVPATDRRDQVVNELALIAQGLAPSADVDPELLVGLAMMTGAEWGGLVGAQRIEEIRRNFRPQHLTEEHQRRAGKARAKKRTWWHEIALKLANAAHCNNPAAIRHGGHVAQSIIDNYENQNHEPFPVKERQLRKFLNENFRLLPIIIIT